MTSHPIQKEKIIEVKRNLSLAPSEWRMERIFYILFKYSNIDDLKKSLAVNG